MFKPRAVATNKSKVPSKASTCAPAAVTVTVAVPKAEIENINNTDAPELHLALVLPSSNAGISNCSDSLASLTSESKGNQTLDDNCSSESSLTKVSPHFTLSSHIDLIKTKISEISRNESLTADEKENQLREALLRKRLIDRNRAKDELLHKKSRIEKITDDYPVRLNGNRRIELRHNSPLVESERIMTCSISTLSVPAMNLNDISSDAIDKQGGECVGPLGGNNRQQFASDSPSQPRSISSSSRDSPQAVSLPLSMSAASSSDFLNSPNGNSVLRCPRSDSTIDSASMGESSREVLKVCTNESENCTEQSALAAKLSPNELATQLAILSQLHKSVSSSLLVADNAHSSGTSDCKSAGDGRQDGGTPDGTEVNAMAASKEPTDSGVTVDDEGYYKGKPAEIIGQRYRIMSVLGKGVFSCVLRCKDVRTSALVAVKVMRCSSSSAVSTGVKELEVLRALKDADAPDPKRSHIVRLIGTQSSDSFYLGQHLCLILENMNMNLRKCTVQQGKGKGLPLSCIRDYGRQLFKALKFIHQQGYIHADIKPDNILVSDDLSTVKLCDFGSSILISDAKSVDDNAYVAARFYRSPEVVLCCVEKSGALDVWALSTTLLEVYRGSLVFTGESNNDLLWNMINTVGPVSRRLIRTARQKQHFEELNSGQHLFLRRVLDKHSGKEVVRKLHIPSSANANSDISAIVFAKKVSDKAAASASSASVCKEQQTMFRDFLLRGLTIDPVKRVSAMTALSDSFFNDHS